jgi:FKBP-type peptidyl-prolyl cis-trans isomerase
MKKTALFVTFCLSAAAPLLADGTNMLTDDKSRLSYAIGMTTGHQWKLQDLDFDLDLYARGIKDAMAGGAMLLTPEQAQQAIDAFKIKFTARQQQKQIELTAKNKTEGEAFLAKNKTQPGVVSLPDGLQYKIISEGNGEVPGADDTVTMNYRGTFVDGTEFDSSARTGKPLQAVVGRLPPGWSEALKLMKTGSKWQLFIPAELAYGQNGKASLIPPNAALIFEVELVAVEHPNPQPAPTPPPSANPPLTSDIIRVPSAEEMKNGAKIEIIKPEDVQKLQQSQPQPGK